jgi:hypothetical protein
MADTVIPESNTGSMADMDNMLEQLEQNEENIIEEAVHVEEIVNVTSDAANALVPLEESNIYE